MEKAAQRQWLMTQLKESLQGLAVEAREQLRLLPDFVVKTDELVLDFDDARLCAVGNYRHEMTAAQLEILADIDAHIASGNLSGDRTIWDEAALESHPFWKRLRELAADALTAFGWPKETPPGLERELIRGSVIDESLS